VLTPGAVVLLASSTGASANETLRRALRDPDPDVRRAAARVASVAHPEVFDTLRQALETEQDAGVVAEFVRDALALGDATAVPLVEPAVRRGGDAAVVAFAEWFARMQPDEFVKRLPEWGRAPGSTGRLEPIVVLAISRHPDHRDRILEAWKPLATEAEWNSTLKGVDAPLHATMRTPTGLVSALLPGTLAAAGCKPDAEMMGNARIEFSPVGRPTHLDVDPVGLSDVCRTALIALARISLDDADSLGQAQTLVVPMMPEFVACLATPDPVVEPRVLGKSAGVSSPRLKKEVKPSYTRRAMREKIEGVTELQAVLSTTGCAKSLQVIRSLDADLDARAIIAVLQWHFDPATADGRPVPVIVSVQLTFKLR
jgi:TonB family protein